MHLINTYMVPFQAFGELGQLLNTSSAHLLTYDVDEINRMMETLKISVAKAEAVYYEKYRAYHACVSQEVTTFNGGYNVLVIALFIGFIATFLLSFLLRHCLFDCFVKYKFTQAQWKKKAAFNATMTAIWTILGALFLYYIYTFAENGKSGRQAQFIAYFSTH